MATGAQRGSFLKSEDSCSVLVGAGALTKFVRHMYEFGSLNVKLGPER